jgi:hypothetical protein
VGIRIRALAGLALLLPLAAAAATLPLTPPATAAASASGLSVFVGYAEDKEINTPDPAAFPVPWAGSPNTTFLGGTVPGQAACGTLPVCYDTGAIRMDNNGPAAVTVTNVSVDMHSSVTGGKVFGNLWGTFSVPAGKSVILAANPPASNPGYDNFDTSGYPGNNCTPLTVAPTVSITAGGVTTTLADSTHVLDTGGIDAGYCAPKRNESIQWRQIGAPGGTDATLTLNPATVTQVTGRPVTETATLLDGSGAGLPNAVVSFAVTSGPDTGVTGSAVTSASGQASFSYRGSGEGEDVVSASVTSVGVFRPGQSRVLWTDDSPAGWTAADVGGSQPAGSQSLDQGTGTWTLSGGGAGPGPGGTADQFRFLWQPEPSAAGIAAKVISPGSTGASAKAGIMLRASTDPGAPYYAALLTPGAGITIQGRSSQGGPASTVTSVPGPGPAYLWVTSSGGTATAYQSADGYDWHPVPGSAATVNLGSSALAGLAVTSGSTAALSTATMAGVAVGGPPPPALPQACPGPWACADIGNPAPAGSQSFDPGTGSWTISGGGADISGTSDQFRFAWQPLSGDGSVSARVASQTSSSANAKAGVMLRASTDPGAPDYAVLASPGAGIKVQVRTAQGGATTKIANPAGGVPVFVKVSRSGSTCTAYTSSDGVSWTLIPGSAATLSLGASALAGLAVTSHNTGALSTVTMDGAAVSGAGQPPPPPPPPPACPASWTCADIGSPAPAGTQSYDPGTGTWTISAAGADITGTSDQFRFAWQPLSGDGSFSAQVASQANTSSSAKAGVMLRASTDPGAANYAVVVTPGTGIKVQVRSTQGGTTTKIANPAGTVPAYLKVTRSGGTCTAYTSSDGVTWTLIGGSAATVSLGAAPLAGLAVTSHHAGTLGTVTMTGVTAG